jgi:hypothetical protein
LGEEVLGREEELAAELGRTLMRHGGGERRGLSCIEWI